MNKFSLTPSPPQYVLKGFDMTPTDNHLHWVNYCVLLNTVCICLSKFVICLQIRSMHNRAIDIFIHTLLPNTITLPGFKESSTMQKISLKMNKSLLKSFLFLITSMVNIVTFCFRKRLLTFIAKSSISLPHLELPQILNLTCLPILKFGSDPCLFHFRNC